MTQKFEFLLRNTEVSHFKNGGGKNFEMKHLLIKLKYALDLSQNNVRERGDCRYK